MHVLKWMRTVYKFLNTVRFLIILIIFTVLNYYCIVIYLYKSVSDSLIFIANWPVDHLWTITNNAWRVVRRISISNDIILNTYIGTFHFNDCDLDFNFTEMNGTDGVYAFVLIFTTYKCAEILWMPFLLLPIKHHELL